MSFSSMLTWLVLGLLVFLVTELRSEKNVGEFQGQGQKAIDKRVGYITWWVTVETGDDENAGTDAGIFIRIGGKSGETEEKELDNPGNDFERNAVDKFVIKLEDVGQLNYLKVRNNDVGAAAGWYIDEIKMCDDSSMKCYTFPCRSWLATDLSDGLLERTFYPIIPNPIRWS